MLSSRYFLVHELCGQNSRVRMTNRQVGSETDTLIYTVIYLFIFLKA